MLMKMLMWYPKMSVNVSASAPHTEGTEYRVSIGEEDWRGIPNCRQSTDGA